MNQTDSNGSQLSNPISQTEVTENALTRINLENNDGDVDKQAARNTAIADRTGWGWGANKPDSEPAVPDRFSGKDLAEIFISLQKLKGDGRANNAENRKVFSALKYLASDAVSEASQTFSGKSAQEARDFVSGLPLLSNDKESRARLVEIYDNNKASSEDVAFIEKRIGALRNHNQH